VPNAGVMPALYPTADSDGSDTDAAPGGASRRSVLGAVGTALLGSLAGCAAAAGETGQPEGPTLVGTTLRVAPGRSASRRFTLDDERWVTVAATLSDRSVDVKQDGPAVDVVVMTPAQYERYRDDEAFAHLPGVSMPDVVNGEVASTLGAGDYVLVVDNTATGPAEPAGSGVPAVVDLTVTAAVERERATAGVHSVGR
jgi:hypothetical protein